MTFSLCSHPIWIGGGGRLIQLLGSLTYHAHHYQLMMALLHPGNPGGLPGQGTGYSTVMKSGNGILGAGIQWHRLARHFMVKLLTGLLQGNVTLTLPMDNGGTRGFHQSLLTKDAYMPKISIWLRRGIGFKF